MQKYAKAIMIASYQKSYYYNLLTWTAVTGIATSNVIIAVNVGPPGVKYCRLTIAGFDSFEKYKIKNPNINIDTALKRIENIMRFCIFTLGSSLDKDPVADDDFLRNTKN